ncbi:hypothetical protein [Glutamicibacter ardleyensis]|uniref:hypothetical protein n=1 Tax=Glutamicibacter ardleyensis TaxID=225894 RepID=UPI003FD1A6A6
MAKTETTKTYTTVTDVPLFRVGQWHPIQGDGTVTLELLEAIYAASQDARLDPGVIKLGHDDDRFDNPDYFVGDGEPAYGQVNNLRITDDEGGTLFGDFINVPEDLANVMASAYPFRSVEITPGVVLQEAEGEVLAEFPFVLTAVALLGAAAPAVSGLGAIHEAFAGKRKVIRHVVDATGHYALAGGHTFESLRNQLRTALDSRVGANEYVWVADLDDAMVIYENETTEGSAYLRETFTINTDGTVTLSGQPEQVVRRTSFEPVAQNSTLPHFTRTKKQSVSVQKPAAVVVAGKRITDTPSKEDIMTPEQIKKLREQGLISAEVTDDDVLAALTPADEAGADADDAANQEPAENLETPAVPEPIAASKATPAPSAPATVQMSAAQFADMQARLTAAEKTIQAGVKVETQRRHDAIIATAKREGRIHPKDEANYRTLLASNEEQTSALLTTLQPVVHTTEFGSATADFAAGTEDAVLQAQMKIDAEFLNGGTK